MKKTTHTSTPTRGLQPPSEETLTSAVTQLRANISSTTKPVEPDIDLNDLRAAIDELSEFNATKVVALHRRINNGDYKIDSERLADKLIELESSLDSD